LQEEARRDLKELLRRVCGSQGMQSIGLHHRRERINPIPVVIPMTKKLGNSDWRLQQ